MENSQDEMEPNFAQGIFFDLWFKAMDKFGCSTSYLYFYLCGMLSDPELGQLSWFN